VAALLVVLLAGAVVEGGTYVYIHYIEQQAPKALDVTTATTPADSSGAASAAPVPVAGVWKVTAGSLVGYRVKEVLFGQHTEAYGRTPSASGTLTISGTSVDAASFTADLTSVHSDQSRRDAQFQGRIMDTSQFPTATFVLTSPIAFGTVPAPGKAVTQTAIGKLTLHGVTRTVTLPVKAVRRGALLEVSGRIPVTFADYQIANPSFGGVTTDDHGILEFLLVMKKS
jgi:polyisoprenoid-binding protein YceI